MAHRISWLKTLIKLGTLLAFSGLAITCAVILYLAPALPSVDQLRDVKLQTPLKVFSEDGILIGEFGEQKRTPINYDQIPPQLIHAILSAEDDNFFHHYGVDPIGILRAVSEILTTGQKGTGGSTITMQVARNFFLSRKTTFTRKFNEILLALQIEHELSKEEILELYANKIYLGKRAYGVQAAANVYYGTDISELNLAQLAMIAVLPKFPSSGNPVNNPERALTRRDWILGRMHQLGYIDKTEYETAVNEPVTAKVYGSVVEINAPYISEMVRSQMFETYGPSAYEDGFEVTTTIDIKLQEAAAQAVKKGLLTYDERHGYRGPEANFSIDLVSDIEAINKTLGTISSVSDLIPAVVTEVFEDYATIFIKDAGTHVLEWQDGLETARPFRTQSWRGEPPKTASEVLAVGDLIRVQNQTDRWKLTQIPNAQAAIVAIDPETGGIKALRGGFDFYHNRFNRIMSAKRQPGSNLKPFLYTAALENGFTAATTINDAPIVFDDAALEDIWRPENDSGKFYGPTRFREALYFSRNLVSIRILREVGLKTARNSMKKFGFDDSELATNLTLALGSEALPPIKIAGGYTAFANGGYKVEPYFIDEIKDRNGEIIFKSINPRVCRKCEENNKETISMASSNEAGLPPINEENLPEQLYLYPEAEKILEPRVHFIIDSILKDVIQKGTGRRAKTLARSDIAGKTGTSNGPRDAWFSGYSPHMVATAWVGFDDNSMLGSGEFGGTAALPIWIDFMKVALGGKEEIHFDQPPGLVIARINPKTGKRASPEDKNAIFEYFLRENTPAELLNGNQQNSQSSGSSAVDNIF